MMWYNELMIYAVCGVMTVSAMRVTLNDGEAGWQETVIFAIFWPFFALMLLAVMVVKIISRKGGGK